MTEPRRWPTAVQIHRMEGGQLVALYVEAAIGADRLDTPSKLQNRAADCIARIYRELRSRGPEAQRLLLPLLNDPRTGVRGWAAAHALEFEPSAGEQVLQALAKDRPGLRGFSAEMTLREWRAGRLKFP
jgi:Domain of unknown function (DUF2019)